MMRNIISTTKHQRSQITWGTKCNSGITRLHILTPGTTMNDENYVKLLKEKPAIHMHIHKCTIFMHDGGPYHHSKKGEELSDDGNSHNARVAQKQPDLNPIENQWEIPKRKAADKQLSSASVLVYAINNIWIKEISAVLPTLRLQHVATHPGCDTEQRGTYRTLTMWNISNIQVMLLFSLQIKTKDGLKHLEMTVQRLSFLL